MPHVSVIIPAYNEEKRLLPTLQSVHDFLRERGEPFEIVVVDDGSTDQTIEVVQEFGKHHDNIRLISYAPNKGKGHAVRVGMLAAKGDYVIFDDADGSSPIAEIVRLESAIDCGAAVAIGSRNMPTQDVTVQALVHRKHIGNTFNMIVQSLLLPGIRDTQCGFKMFRHEIAQDIFSVATQNGYAFDVEVLFIARLRGYKIAEVAINWSNVEGSKVNVVRDSIKMFCEVVRITVGGWTGRYRRLVAES